MSKRTKVQLHKERAFPLNGNCQAENIVYEATITCNERTYGENIYIGIAETIPSRCSEAIPEVYLGLCQISEMTPFMGIGVLVLQ